MDKLVNYELSGAVATITLDDGKANVLSPAMLIEINEALDKALADSATVLLVGRPSLFSAGFDLKVLRAGGAASREMLMAGFRLAERMLSFPKPVVIACSGHALAMASFLLVSGDYRLGASGDFKIGANEVAIGMTLPHTAIELCRQRIALPYLGRVAINAEIFTPEAAVAPGFLDEVVPAAELTTAARAKALALSELDMGAHSATKLRLRGDALVAIGSAMEIDDRELALLG